MGLFILSFVVLLLLLLSGAVLQTSTMDIRLWPRVHQAKRYIYDEVLRKRGVLAKVYMNQSATRADPRYLSIWVITNTDTEREVLRSSENFIAEVREQLRRAKYPSLSIDHVKIGVESRQTIEAEYGGNVREMMENP